MLKALRVLTAAATVGVLGATAVQAQTPGLRRDTWFPYVVGGLGGKPYDLDTQGRATDFAGSFGGGIEYRFAQWGLQVEVRDIVSSFARFGVDDTQHDVVWTAGLTLSF